MAYRILVMVGILALDAGRTSVVQRDAPKPASDTGTITGVVVAADTRTPLADVAVTLRPADQLPTPRPGALVEVFKSVPAATVRTDAAGQVALVGMPPGRYRIVAEPGPAAGKYISTRCPDPAIDDSVPIAVSASHIVDGLVIALARGAVISGRIVDEVGHPLALVSVSAHELLPGERLGSVVPMSMGAATRTDDNGAFGLFGLRAGEFVVAARSTRQDPLSIEPGTAAAVPALPSAYYPGTTVLKDARRIRIADGDELGPLIFALPPVRLLTIRAAVVDSSGQPASHVSVACRPGDGIGRHVSAAVKREVWERDGGQCAFVGTIGRCTERGFLEYHHVVPFPDGGATTAPNLELRCRAHNAYEAEQWFGVGEGNLVQEARASCGERRRPTRRRSRPDSH